MTRFADEYLRALAGRVQSGTMRVNPARYSMVSHDDFAAAINANPDDMVARGAYADWLEERDLATPAALRRLRYSPPSEPPGRGLASQPHRPLAVWLHPRYAGKVYTPPDVKRIDEDAPRYGWVIKAVTPAHAHVHIISDHNDNPVVHAAVAQRGGSEVWRSRGESDPEAFDYLRVGYVTDDGYELHSVSHHDHRVGKTTVAGTPDPWNVTGY